MAKGKSKVLILNGQYLPGYKGGGPIQSCANMVENLSNQFEFYVICADRDYKEEQPYKNVDIDQWNRIGNANVFYMSPDRLSLAGFEKLLNMIEYDVLYLNGFFSPIFTIRPLVLRKLGKLKNKNAKIVLTPRGDFTGGCENKKLKKYSYIYFVKAVGLYDDLLWHATSEIEERDIKRKFPGAETITVANLPLKFAPHNSVKSKESGKLRLVFISRIFPKKNLKYALEVLKQIKKGEVIFDIYGPMEDVGYWGECEELIRKMPPNVKVSYCGEVEHKEISHVFEQYHAFLFPTWGENYGHVIVEAMMSNCLCILSKSVTPWDDYIELLGYGASLEQKEKFERDIRELISLNQEKWNSRLEINNKYVADKFSCGSAVEDYIKMFKYR